MFPKLYTVEVFVLCMIFLFFLDLYINENAKIDVSFNSQLNTIIGGRGSGKSSIIRTIAGGMNSFSGENLNIISQEQMEFYKENGKQNLPTLKRGFLLKIP